MSFVLRRWTGDEFQASAALWQALLEHSGADPLFLSHAWQATWWSRYGGRGRELCVIAGYDAGQLVGIAPFYLEQETGIRSACLLGGARLFGGDAGMMTEYLDVIARPEIATRFRTATLEYLLKDLGVDECRIMVTAAASEWRKAAEPLAVVGAEVRCSNDMVSHQADLRAGFAAYVAGLKGSVRRALWNRRALLQQLGPVEYEVAVPQDLELGLAQLNELHAIRWGEPVFEPGGIAFHEQLAGALGSLACVRLTRLRVAGQLLSVLFDIEVGRRRYNIQMGFDDQFDSRLSLGLLHLGYAMEDAAASGVEVYDFLAGRGQQSDYKLRLAQSQRPVADVLVTKRPAASRVVNYLSVQRQRIRRRPIERVSVLPDWREPSGIVRRFLDSSGHGPRLRVGLLLDRTLVRRPFAVTLAQISRSSFAEIAAIVMPRTPPADQGLDRPALLSRLTRMALDPQRRRQLVFSLYERLDQLAHPQATQLLGFVDASAVLGEAPCVLVDASATGPASEFTPADIATLRALDLDVLIRYGFGILKGEVLTVARHGVWSYHHGDSEFYRGAPPGFWELYEQSLVSGAILQQLNATLDGGHVLDRVRTATESAHSTVTNRVAPYLSAQALVIRTLRRVHQEGWQAVRDDTPGVVPYRGRRRLYRVPGNIEMLQFAAARGARYLRRRVPRWLGGAHQARAVWRIGVRPRAAGAPWVGSWREWHWLAAPDGHYFADPMLCDWQGQAYLFVEDFDLAAGRGSIAVAQLADDGTVGDFRPALVTPYHLSFPNVFSRDGEMYLVPETKAAGRIELFKAVKFPFEWRRERMLLAYPGVESIFQRLPDGRELMITGIADAPMAQVAMHLFVADRLQGDWQLHPRSPVHCDVRYSRNAGPLIHLPDGQVVRASQDGSGFYGRQIHFHRVLQMSAGTYAEEHVATRNGSDIAAQAIGTHSYSATSRWEAIDALLT